VRLSFLAVCANADSSGDTSDSRFKPSGVSSYTQEKTRAGNSPAASIVTMSFSTQAGASKASTAISITWIRTHAATT